METTGMGPQSRFRTRSASNNCAEQMVSSSSYVTNTILTKFSPIVLKINETERSHKHGNHSSDIPSGPMLLLVLHNILWRGMRIFEKSEKTIMEVYGEKWTMGPRLGIL